MLDIAIHRTQLDLTIDDMATTVSLDATIQSLRREGHFVKTIATYKHFLIASSDYGDSAMDLSRPRPTRLPRYFIGNSADTIAQLVAAGQLRCTGIDENGKATTLVGRRQPFRHNNEAA